jgi:Uma2 family endonuclease
MVNTIPSVLISLFIRVIQVLVTELRLKIKSMRSTTLEREDLDRSSEPDNAYYIHNQPLVAGKTVNLKTDLPPDLVEVDITHSDIDKLRLYASMGVPEFWRYNGEVWRIYQPSRAVSRSRVQPDVSDRAEGIAGSVFGAGAAR